MKTSFLNEFMALEKHLNFSNAARELSITQSALSRHIQKLEEEMGVPLFHRTTQKIDLTPYGEALIPHAKAILEHSRAFSQECAEIKERSPNHIILGCCGFPNYYGITGFLSAFKAAYPRAVMDVRIGSTDENLRWLQEGDVNAAFVHNITNLAQEYQLLPFCRDWLSAVLPADHPLAEHETVSLYDLRDETFYLRHSKDSLMDKLEMRTLRSAGFEPKLSHNRGTWGDSVINRGREVSLALRGLSDKLRGNMHLKICEIRPIISVDVCFIYSKKAPAPGLMKPFSEMVEQQAHMIANG